MIHYNFVNLLIIQNCSSSDRLSNNYGCEKLFDVKTTGSSTSWISNANSDWVQLNLDERYYLHSLMIFQHSVEYYRLENVTLEFSNKTIVNISTLNS